MTAPTSTWWLRVSDGVAKRITPGGLLIGRFPQCDVVTRSPSSSRRQALVYLDERGPRVAVMGRGTVAVNGAAVELDQPLDDGVSLEVGDLSLEVVREDASGDEDERSAVWVLESADGGLFSFSTSPFRVGGADSDDLRVEQWPEHALTFRSLGGRLEVEPHVDATIDGIEVSSGATSRLRRGSTIKIDGVGVKIVTGGDLGTGSTVAIEADAEPGARAVRLEFLPRGGRLHVRAGGDEQSVYLTDRRCDFIAVLLKPPPPLDAGDFIPDEQLWNRVWGKQPSGKKTLHVLLHRLRKDLDRVGLDGAELLERAEGGGATRFVLREGARVVLD
ncbi:MAG: helix-turn-helix domain-containing protein [Sandaracinaceae bacterium]|nr:helix-turn-helix domain-containing protein [Sandaracinaceae bacterium]